MATLNRSDFLSQFRNKVIDLKDLKNDSSLPEAIKPKLAAMDHNGDGKLGGYQELNNLFTQIDHFDRNGDADSFRTSNGSTKTSIGHAVSALTRHAKTVSPNTALDGASNNSGLAIGRALGQAAQSEASRRGTTGLCYSAVASSVDKVVGRFLWGSSAYMAADQLASHPKFREVNVTAGNLPGLPSGAVVVWGKTSRSPHGHISISLGNGQEASDHVDTQRTQLRGYTNVRVFLPKA